MFGVIKKKKDSVEKQVSKLKKRITKGFFKSSMGKIDDEEYALCRNIFKNVWSVIKEANDDEETLASLREIYPLFSILRGRRNAMKDYAHIMRSHPIYASSIEANILHHPLF